MKGVVKNLHHIRLLRRQGDSSFARHAQRLDKAIKTPRTHWNSEKTYNEKIKSHLVAPPPRAIALPSTVD